MSKFLYKALFSFSLISLNTFTHASLITNGSFEELTFTDASRSMGIVFNTDLRTYEN